MARYAPLQLPANPVALPQDYQAKIAYFDSTGPYSAIQHAKRMQDHFENYEIDDETIRMRIFVQSLTGDVRTWFRSLPANSIATPDELYQSFTNRWEKKKDPLHILGEYDMIKRGPQETVLEYCARFNNVYNAIPQNLRPPPDLALYKFPDGFDPDMAYQLKERAPQTLEEAQRVAVTVEANLIAKRNRAKVEKRVVFKEEPSALDQKLDAIISGMKRLGDRVESVERKSSWEAPSNNPGRNPNFRRNPNAGSSKANNDPEIRPPFQENYAEASTSEGQAEDTHIHLMGLDNKHQVFLSQEDEDEEDRNQFQTKSGESFDFKQGFDTAVYEVHKQYKLRSRTVNVTQPEKTKDKTQPEGATVFQPKSTNDSPLKEVTIEDITEQSRNSPTSLAEYPKPNKETQEVINKNRPKHQEQTSEEKESKLTNTTKAQIEKPFDLENEIGKLKITIPLAELAKNEIYRQQIQKSLQLTHTKGKDNVDNVNVLDDTPELLFGPEVDGKIASSGILPFYVSLHIHDKILHNAMFDSGASHNLMPKSVMERLNLDITRPYKDLYSFDSSQVECLGLIKDLCVSLVQYPNKTILMDVVVADIPPKYGMLLSRSWGAKLQGSLQLDMSYATITVFGQPKRLYRESLMKYMVSSTEKPQNFPIYAVHSDIDSFILYNDNTNSNPKENIHMVETNQIAEQEGPETTAQTESGNAQNQDHSTNDMEASTIQQNKEKRASLENKAISLSKEDDSQIKPMNQPTLQITNSSHTNLTKESLEKEIQWFLEFDGSVNKLGAGAGVWVHNKEGNHAEGRAYRLNFRCTNNMAEYEALLLGLKLIHSLQISRISVLGDSDLVIQQIKGNFVTKDNRLRSYRTAATQLLSSLANFQITKIPRAQNLHAHSLAMFASTCKLPFDPNHRFTAEIRHRPSIPDNIKDWQVFDNDAQINNFLTLQEEFSSLNIDTQPASQSQLLEPASQTEILHLNHSQVLPPQTVYQLLNPTIFNQDNIQKVQQIECEQMPVDEIEIIQLKSNLLPIGLAPLEDMFDSNDVPGKPKFEPLNTTIEEHNIGSLQNPKIIKLSAALPPDQKPKYIDLFKEFQDVFAWSYEDLKSYDTSVIQHTIPLKPNQKPFKQKLRRINPMLLPAMEQEVQKMFQAGIIAPIRFSDWISNLVPTRKKTGEIRLCVDLRNLNQVSLKDNYPLPKMDHILQRVVGASRISLLDGFSGFNQILVHPDDQDKTAFTTPWGTFKYVKMPFGLKNAGATFQRAMDIAFAKEIHDFLVIYLDDLTPFSKSDQEHLSHLRQIFLKCRKFGISLNPKKSIFGLEEGKLLGHIISKDGIRIDPDRIQAIQHMPHPRNIKELQAFLGKINFLRRFIPNLAELSRLLNNMLKKDSKVKWTVDAKQAFESIKFALTQTPVLTSPQFDRDFIIFSFASEHTIAAVLLQKDDLGNEKPIAFFSKALRDAPLKYQIMEKQAYALVKAIKDFRIYILYSHIIAYVPSPIVKDILTQENLEGRRGKWIANILEFDIEIKPTKLIKGQGLAKLMTETNFQALDINQLDSEQELATPQINVAFEQSPWYSDICYVLQNLCAPPGLSRTRSRFVKMKASKFCIMEEKLFWRNHEGILLNCLIKDETNKIMEEFHAGECGGHLYWKSTVNKILRAGYYWPTIFSDVKRFTSACHKCQVFEGKRQLLPLPLRPIATERPFQQWGLDFIGEIIPSSSGQHRWILTATDYFTKWIEAIPCRQANDSTIIQFLEANILARFGCPDKIITDNAAAFRSKKMVNFCHKFHITLGHSTAYYPQGNGLAESSNKSLVNMVKKILEENKKNWHKKLVNALWADRVTTKRSIGVSPYELVYGLEAKFPSSLGIPAMKILQECQAEPNSMQRRISQVICLQQTREEVYNRVQVLQEKLKKAFDRRTKAEDFNIGDKVLKWDSRRESKGKHGKFDSLWKGPFVIQAVQGNNTYFLQDLQKNDLEEGPVNGRMLKHYFDYFP